MSCINASQFPRSICLTSTEPPISEGYLPQTSQQRKPMKQMHFVLFSVSLPSVSHLHEENLCFKSLLDLLKLICSETQQSLDTVYTRDSPGLWAHLTNELGCIWQLQCERLLATPSPGQKGSPSLHSAGAQHENLRFVNTDGEQRRGMHLPAEGQGRHLWVTAPLTFPPIRAHQSMPVVNTTCRFELHLQSV